MEKIKIFFNWFTAKDARNLYENYSGLKITLKRVAEKAKEGGNECFAYQLSAKDIAKLKQLGYSVSKCTDPSVDSDMVVKYKISW